MRDAVQVLSICFLSRSDLWDLLKTAMLDLQTPHGRIKFKGYGVILSFNLEGENSSTPKPRLVQHSFSREKQRFLTRVLLL